MNNRWINASATRLRTRGPVVAALAIVVAVTFTAGVAVAATTVVTGNTIDRIAMMRSTDTISGSPDGYVDFDGAQLSITVPSGGVLRARFTSSVSCTGPASADFCLVRVLANGRELKPGPYRFDSISSADDEFEIRTGEWSSAPLPGGTYTVKVQWAAREDQTKPLAVATFHRFHFTVERITT